MVLSVCAFCLDTDQPAHHTPLLHDSPPKPSTISLLTYSPRKLHPPPHQQSVGSIYLNSRSYLFDLQSKNHCPVHALGFPGASLRGEARVLHQLRSLLVPRSPQHRPTPGGQLRTQKPGECWEILNVCVNEMALEGLWDLSAQRRGWGGPDTGIAQCRPGWVGMRVGRGLWVPCW